MSARIFFRIVATSLFCAAISVAVAKEKDRDFHGGNFKKKKAPPSAAELQAHISSVSGNAVTITDQNGSKTVTTNQFTEITVNGQRATLADLKSGMIVNLGLSAPTQASRITATSTK